MSTTAVILARRGSKGVPGKNLAAIAGRPCLAWTIDDALHARSVDEVIVSTDWPEAASLAADMGARVIERPAALAGDMTTVDDAVRHAVARLACDAVVILYGNVPVRPPGLVDRAVTLLRQTSAPFDSVQSYCAVGKHHPWWTCRIGGADGRVTPWEGRTLFHGVYRRQDLPAAHVPDGGVLVVTRPALDRAIPGVPDGPHAFLGREDRRGGIVTLEGEVVDIDTRVDLLVADALLRQRRATPCPGAEQPARVIGGVA